MISQPVVSREQLEERLEALDCEPTGIRLETGELWKAASGRHFIVPDSIQGYYPDWLLWDLEEIIGTISPWTQ